ncbi:hypothetical protein QQS21_009724 [Conoideocrella luteorostrata]|uniref:Uncharacterized protein n=1 Tax=Conoideocrella luteorostrata TaxID=1105319 RepID=A0AAJ0CJ42_9HYPO|nr:hypothetical protein QQS21_009724 [Conoideocrella luteorostrata]
MAAPVFHSYPGLGEWAKDKLHYSQAVKVDNLIKCSGQGGWDAKNQDVDFENLIPSDLLTEIDQAFANCDYNLRHAGGKGCSQVYKVVTYTTDMAGAHDRIVYNLRKWMPNNPPIWTELGVKELGLPTMRFEIDVEAHIST